jgi:glycosyltransferase involved in cell wall biosynthesis
MCDRLITVTQDLRETLIRDGVPSEKIVCVPNAIDLELYERMGTAREARRAELGVPDSALVVGSVSRLAPIKNLPMLLSVAARLVEEGAEVRFVIVGEGPERDRLEDMATRLGIARFVAFTGWRTDVPELLAAFDVLAMTSFSEAMPIVALEAMALSRPVVATSVGGMKELVQDTRTGHLVAPGDVEAMTRVLHSFARDRERARVMGEAGRARVRRDFTRTKMLRSTRRIYASALRREGTPGHADLTTARAG